MCFQKVIKNEMAKILAQDYFEDSRLFNAKVLDGNEAKSATSSSVKYELTCKECGAVTQRTGNSKALNVCGKCKLVWDRDNNQVRFHGWYPGKKEKSSAEVMAEIASESDSDDEPIVVKPKVPARRKADVAVATDEDNAPVVNPDRRKITTGSIADLLTGKAKPKTKVAPVAKPKKDTYEFETIVDYYDERLADSWHRYYYVQWVGSPEPTFVLDEDFTDSKAVNEFELTLPEVERFKVMFPKTSRKNKTTKHAVRSKIDVLSEHGDEDKETIENFTLPPPVIPLQGLPKASCIEIKQSTFTHIQLKKGQVYKIGDIIIEAI